MKRLLLLLLIVMCGCGVQGPECDRLAVTVDPAEVIWNPEPNIAVRFSASSFPHSHVDFSCSAWWDGSPTVEYAPTGLITELCVGGRCEKGPSRVVEFKIWAAEWNDLKNYESAYCVVYMPSWERMELQPDGRIIVVETYPERVVARYRYPITFECEQDDEPDNICLDGYYSAEGWECTQWS